MSLHAHLSRHLHLTRYLLQARGRAVPFEQIQRYLLEYADIDGLHEYDKRTFQRDKLAIDSNFGFLIRCRRRHGYYLIETDDTLEGHQRLLDAFELQEFLRLPQALAPYVQPETRRAQGLEHLRPLLRAAQAGQVVAFSYQKYWEDAPQTRTAGPLLLKEFRGRWYVLAMMAGSGRLACFGLDRISELRVTAQAFTPPPNFDAATYYQHAFGITRPDNGEEPQEFRLRFTPVQGRYVLNYPLHASQRLVHETEEEIQVTLTVYDTHELRMELLSYGPEMEVLAPPALRDWMNQMHQEAVL